jgi:cytochrome o ubiquinol oxidase subunit 2
MKRNYKIVLIVLGIVASILATVLYVQNNTIAVLEPKGIIAEKERDLLIITSLLMLVVVVPAILFTLIFDWMYRVGDKQRTFRPEWGDSHLAEILWWGIPSVIVVILSVLTYTSSHELNPYKPLETDKKPLTIQVVALDWKWLFIYPEQSIATVNFIQFPVDTPINFEITADAPMNSFWIPQLGGQIYAMPAMRTKLHLMAKEEGVFRGCSAHISGVGFAGMVFQAKASTEKEFNAWVRSVEKAGTPLTLEEYNKLVKPTEYDPVTYYRLGKKDLFDYIVTKYDLCSEDCR